MSYGVYVVFRVPLLACFESRLVLHSLTWLYGVYVVFRVPLLAYFERRVVFDTGIAYAVDFTGIHEVVTRIAYAVDYIVV